MAGGAGARIMACPETRTGIAASRSRSAAAAERVSFHFTEDWSAMLESTPKAFEINPALRSDVVRAIGKLRTCYY